MLLLLRDGVLTRSCPWRVLGCAADVAGCLVDQLLTDSVCTVGEIKASVHHVGSKTWPAE